MDTDTYFSPPDPSGEVHLPILPTDPPQSGTRARAAMLVAGALIAVAGVFVLGRWTTGGERDALAGERDAARHERSALDARVNELERDVATVTADNADKQSAIEDLQQTSSQHVAELTKMRDDLAASSSRVAALEDGHRAVWDRVSAVSVCAAVSPAADDALDSWDEMFTIFGEYLDTPQGSPEEQDAIERLDAAWVAIDDAESAYITAKTRCESALDELPDCDSELATMTVAVEAFEAKTDEPPQSEDELVAEGFIRQPSDQFDLTNGTVTPAQGSPCPATA